VSDTGSEAKYLLTKIEREMRAVPAEKKAVNIQSDSVEV